MGFDRAVVLTHDRWKHEAGGIPPFCFLLATARDVAHPTRDDDEVLLLRVEGTAPLSMENELLAVREEALREALSSSAGPSPSTVLDFDGLDPYTRNRVSFTGLDCRILGTFYEDSPDGQVRLEWGHDVDNFYATRTYHVYKAIGDGLSFIASFLKPGPDDPVERVRIGAVRYSSTRRRALAAQQADAPVLVNIHDFIGHKTGMFGMTRMGKSNTMKTIAARTFIVSEQARRSGGPLIGQLIFDPQGEYANPNVQDGTELAAIGPKHVSLYRYGPADPANSHVKPLGINFFDPVQIEAVQHQVKAMLAGDTGAYVKAFAVADFSGASLPTDTHTDAQRRRQHAERGRFLLYAALVRAGFEPPTRDLVKPQYPYRVWVPINRELADDIQAALPGSFVRPQGGRTIGVNRERIVEIAEFLASDDLGGAVQQRVDNWRDNDACRSAIPLLTQRSQNRAVSGYVKLKPLRGFHSPDSASDFRRDIYAELLTGRVVVVDLHLGPSEVIVPLSEQLVGHVIDEQLAQFTKGKDVPRVQVMVEEAHNLFGADAYREGAGVWVKLAKEASKLRIGLIYATQEVTGVAHQVLANTKNWVVAHLNNTKELRELSKFYDFEAHAASIVKAEDKGYVRLKTMSSPYIVPVQIDRYGPDLVNEARAAAGESPLSR